VNIVPDSLAYFVKTYPSLAKKTFQSRHHSIIVGSIITGYPPNLYFIRKYSEHDQIHADLISNVDAISYKKKAMCKMISCMSPRKFVKTDEVRSEFKLLLSSRGSSGRSGLNPMSCDSHK
jgi:hypothetical protein